MLAVLLQQQRQADVLPVTRLAYATTLPAFDLLCALTESKGLVWEGGPDDEVAAVLHHADPSWPH